MEQKEISQFYKQNCFIIKKYRNRGMVNRTSKTVYRVYKRQKALWDKVSKWI